MLPLFALPQWMVSTSRPLSEPAELEAEALSVALEFPQALRAREAPRAPTEDMNDRRLRLGCTFDIRTFPSTTFQRSTVLSETANTPSERPLFDTAGNVAVHLHDELVPQVENPLVLELGASRNPMLLGDLLVEDHLAW